MSGPAPLAVHFTNRSADPDGDFMVSNWDLGDGTFSTEASPTHTYTSAGDFTVTLQVSDVPTSLAFYERLLAPLVHANVRARDEFGCSMRSERQTSHSHPDDRSI